MLERASLYTRSFILLLKLTRSSIAPEAVGRLASERECDNLYVSVEGHESYFSLPLKRSAGTTIWRL